MTSVHSGSDKVIYRSTEEVAAAILTNILANTKRQIGTEWEMFFLRQEFFTDPAFFSKPDSKAFLRADGQRAFAEFRQVFALMGYATKNLTEMHPLTGEPRTVGINIPALGSIIPEAGYQFEFAASVCSTLEELHEKNEEAHRAILEVARRLDCVVAFRGHVPGYAEKTEGMDRSRGEQWRAYYGSDSFDPALTRVLREAQDGTASVQVTIDGGAKNFHEFFQALLLLEPALSLHYANSQRSYVGMRAYGDIIPTQVTPLVSVWRARNPAEAVAAIVERLMTIDVPFLPDPDRPGLYRLEPHSHHRPPTVRDLLEQGRLSEKMLNNVGGFFYTRPALKNFAQGLLEMRGIDSQPTPGRVTEIAQRVLNLVYDDNARRQLLADYSFLTPDHILQLHRVAVMAGHEELAQITVGSLNLQDFVADMLRRSMPGQGAAESDDNSLSLIKTAN